MRPIDNVEVPEPVTGAGVSPRQLLIGLGALGLYGVGAAVAVWMGVSWSEFIALEKEQLRSDPPVLEVTVRFKKLPTDGYGEKFPELAINSVSGPPYVWQEVKWGELMDGEPEPVAGVPYTFKVPITGELASRFRKDGKVKWSFHWHDARIRQHTLSP